MKLDYPTASNSDSDYSAAELILLNDRHWRVEMHICRNEDDSYTLVSLSGLTGQLAELSKSQGPYQNRPQCEAARAAIARQLQLKGFKFTPKEHSIWILQAQKVIRATRNQRIASQGNYDFHPDDVL